MADLLIKDKKMPKNCSYCDLYDIATDWCEAINDEILGFDPLATRFDGCPLVEVPAHGRLIDANVLYEKTAEWEAQALHLVEVHMDDEDPNEWRKWSTVLTERSAFKYDIADATTVIEESEEKKYELL